MKKLFTLTLALLASFSLWAETIATTTYGTTSHTYLNVAGTTSNAKIKNGADCVTFGMVYLNSIKASSAWFSTSLSSSNSNITPSSYNLADNGFLTYAGNSTPSYTQAYGQYSSVKSSANVEFWVTGTTGVAIIGQGNGSSKYIVLHIDEVGADGTTLTAVGTDVKQNNTAAALVHASTLNASNYYKVTVTADNTSNNKLGQIRFEAPPAVDETAPVLVSSTPASGAIGVETSGTIVLTFDEAIASVDASKFTLTGATKGEVAIDGTDAKKVNVAYSGAEELEVVTLAVAAEAVADAAGNKSAALSNISFTTEGTCTAPTITTDLSTTLVEYDKDVAATPLAIVATGQSLTYQWYSNTTNSTEDATSLGIGAQTANYTPSTATLGTLYYFCVVSSGTCTTTSEITPIKVSIPRTVGWVIFDGMTDESFASGSIEYNSVTVNYTVVGNSMLGAGDVTNRNKNNDFNDYTYPNAVKMNMNDGATAGTTGYLSFTIPTGYQLNRIIFAVAFAGGGRNVVLAKSAVTDVNSEDVIKSLKTGGNSDRIYDATYQPESALPAGTYYMCSPIGGSWNIFHLQLVLEPASATALDNTEAGVKAVKSLKNGVLIIEKNGKKYNIIGSEIR